MTQAMEACWLLAAFPYSRRYPPMKSAKKKNNVPAGEKQATQRPPGICEHVQTVWRCMLQAHRR